jgi:F-type H+-transporting ATPase subunit a
MPGIFRFLCALLVVAPVALSAQSVPVTAALVATLADVTEAVAADVATAAAPEQAAGDGPVDFITPHITDASYLELPYWKAPFHTYVELPKFPPVHIGSVTIDLSPTKHVVMMLIAATLLSIILIVAARASRRDHATEGRSKGFGGAMEALALYLRNEVVLPNVGHHGEKYVPFALTLFFFILFMNLLGMIPFGATATGNISVTATLAIITFIMVEAAGMRANGVGYLNTMFYWNNDLPAVMRPIMFLVMSPVEMIGKLTKPFALAIRLFANMTAGHIVLLALIGLVFSFQSWLLAPAPLVMALAISVLELFVAFLQAFIFTLLASVFIGQVREAHH